MKNLVELAWEAKNEAHRVFVEAVGEKNEALIVRALHSCRVSERLWEELVRESQEPALLEALERVIPWVGKLIADGGHLNSVAPNDAIGALDQAEAAVKSARGG